MIRVRELAAVDNNRRDLGLEVRRSWKRRASWTTHLGMGKLEVWGTNCLYFIYQRLSGLAACERQLDGRGVAVVGSGEGGRF